MNLLLALLVRFLRAGEPEANLEVTLTSAQSGYSARGETDASGVVRFLDAGPGDHLLEAGGAEWELVLAVEMEMVIVELDAPPPGAGRFGRSELTRRELSRLPHAGTASNFLETLDPFAVTDRIDVAGVESGTDPRWSLRGSSWTQNRFLLDGLDVTDPAGGTPLLFPDLLFFEEISVASSANPAGAAGAGAEMNLVTRAVPTSVSGTLAARYSGSALQSDNRSEYLKALGIEPREMHRFPSARLEIGAPGLYGAVSGFELATGLPHFDAEERTNFIGAAGKLAQDRWSLLGMAQRISRPTFGASPGYSVSSTVEAKERFQVFQAASDPGPLELRFGFARGALDSSHSGSAAPLRDLATSEVEDAPLRVIDRTRTRWDGVGLTHRALGSHSLRAGFELSHASEDFRESVPGSMQRLTVDGAAHAATFFSGAGRSQVTIDRLAFHVQDGLFFDLLGWSFRISPGVRLDLSRSPSIRWTSLSAAAGGGVRIAPSVEVHFSAGRYPHLLTTRLAAIDQGLSWTWRRWTDGDGDLDVSSGELGPVLRRGGAGFTSIEDELPRPYTHELTVGVEKHFRRGFLRFSGYQRWEKRLLQTVNLGIAPESYDVFPFLDVGVDGVLGTADDREIAIFDQEHQLGEDLFVLTHPEDLGSFAQGVDLLLGFRRGRFSFRLSGRAYRDVGKGNPGNGPGENDTGIPGDLFHDPNTLTSAEGRLYFDRAFTGKLALTARGPKAIDVGAAVRYWDGQPFARQLFFEELGQGFTVVQAFPRGRLRYAFNMTVDVRIERELRLGRSRLALALDAFNLLNQTLHTAENVRSGETFREPTFVQPARTLALQGRLRF